MIMRFNVILFTVLLLIAHNSLAQRGLGEGRAAKIGVLTQLLNLNEEQAQKFWPIFNEFEGKRKVIRSKYKQTIMDAKQTNSIVKIEETFSLRESEIALEKLYLREFRKVLNDDQVVSFYSFDKEYAKYLLRGMHQRGGTPITTTEQE